MSCSYASVNRYANGKAATRLYKLGSKSGLPTSLTTVDAKTYGILQQNQSNKNQNNKMQGKQQKSSNKTHI